MKPSLRAVLNKLFALNSHLEAVPDHFTKPDFTIDLLLILRNLDTQEWHIDTPDFQACGCLDGIRI